MTGQTRLIVASVTQTGDTAHVAGALALCPGTDALITYDAGGDITLLRALYEHAASNNDRVEFLPIPASQPTENPQKKFYLTLKSCQNLLQPTGSEQLKFQDILGNAAYTTFKDKYLVASTSHPTTAKYAVMPLTEATEQIANAFRADRIKSYSLAARAITLNPTELAVDSIISEDGKVANVALPAKDKTVLLVWARYTGTKTETGFNPEGDSDPVGQKQLLEVAHDLGFSVITVGDAPPSNTIQVVNNEPCVLDEFWNHAPFHGKSRAAQATFFAALMERYPGKLYQIGQKTGAMDFPALLGVPTIYIEDKRIPPKLASRMELWTKDDALQLYRRVEVENPPSLLGRGARNTAENFSGSFAIKREGNGEAKWRLAGLLLELKDTWTTITGNPSKPTAQEVFNLLNKAEENDLKEWYKTINNLSDAELGKAKIIRGYSKGDLNEISAALNNLRYQYSESPNSGKMIIRKPGGKYETRA